MAQSTSEFEQLVAAIRRRVRSNGARLFADWLRSHVGLVCGETSALLNKHIHEVGLQPGHAANVCPLGPQTRKTKRAWQTAFLATLRAVLTCLSDWLIDDV